MGRRSRSEISAIMSGAGVVTAVWTKLDAAVRKLDSAAADACLYRLATEEGDDVILEMAKAAVAAQKKGTAAPVAAPQLPPPSVIDISKFFAPVADSEAIILLTPQFGSEEAARIVYQCRQLAMDEGYTGFIFWRAAAGFLWRTHGPLFGTCRENWKYLQTWRLKNDPTTTDSLAFFVPRLLTGSTGKAVTDQRKLLVETRAKYTLPEPFLKDFGSAAYVAGLTLSHHRITSERTPLDLLWARCETFRVDGGRLDFGNFLESSGLGCLNWDDGLPVDFIGIFPLGVVPILGH